MTDKSDTLSQELQALVESSAGPEELAQQLLFLDIEQTEEDDPELGFCLRACAIPFIFDAEIIGILRGDSQDNSTNEALLEYITEYPFVLKHKEGGYVYHDSIRSLLLDEWQNIETVDEYEKIKQRLLDYFRDNLNNLPSNELTSRLKWLNRLLKLSPNEYEFLLVRASIYFQTGDYKSALADLSRVVKLFSNSDALYFIRGKIYFEIQEYTRSLADYNLAIAINSEEANYFKWRSLLHSTMNNTVKALEDLELVLM
ncbi:MAG: tetratricopeptide repeat protein, partial [Flavobacteriales bacterium]|nr:tetratricopeptide repeat protein [Flavobacteriales bacterium]